MAQDPVHKAWGSIPYACANLVLLDELLRRFRRRGEEDTDVAVRVSPAVPGGWDLPGESHHECGW